MNPSIPDPSGALFQQAEADRRRALRNMWAALLVAPVNLVIIAKTVDREPSLAIASLLILNTIQFVAGVRAKRAGEAALVAWPANMPRPRGARVAVVLGVLAALGAGCIGAFAVLMMFVMLTWTPPHY